MRVRVNRRNQITLPSEVLKKLRIQVGDELLIEEHDGAFVLAPDPMTYVERLRGLHKEVWEGVDVEAYIRGERAPCQE